MSNNATPARAMLDAWREQGADRLDPIRFHFIEALEARSANHGGEVRRLLDDRLCMLLGTYADDLEKATGNIAAVNGSATPGVPARGALSGLIDHIASYAAVRSEEDAATDAAQRPPAFPALEALDAFRAIWLTIRTESQLRRSMEQVPENAGPLNSGALVHRSIALMRELSPGYLQKFLSYVDDLSWMEQVNAVGAFRPKDTAPAINARKRTGGKARSRRE